MDKRGIIFLDACKDYWREAWDEEHAKNNELLRSIILSGEAPNSLPHFSYLKDGISIFEISGFEHRSWYKEHTNILKELTGH